jgi:hypothetical protein
MSENKETGLMSLEQAQTKFVQACEAAEGLSLMQNAGAAFIAVKTVASLREVLTDEIMEAVFMPLMNTKIGFLTDRSGRARGTTPAKPLYSIDIVRDAIIDGVGFGVLPTFNQMNIIAEKMYPTKEGFTALLKKIKVKSFFTFGPDTTPPNSPFGEIIAKINYEYNGDKGSFILPCNIKKDSYSSYDQLKGKAERRAKKALYEYITGVDLGDGDDAQEATVVETTHRNSNDKPIMQQESTDTEFEQQGEPEQKQGNQGSPKQQEEQGGYFKMKN